MSEQQLYNNIIASQDPFSNMRLMLRLYNEALKELDATINNESLSLINKETLKYKRSEIEGFRQQLQYIIKKVG